MKRSFLPFLPLVLAAVHLSPSAQAAVIVANTAPPTGALGVAVDPLGRGAAGFLSPTAATEITSVVVPFDGNGVPNAFPMVTLALYGDTLGFPGTLLATLGTQLMSTSNFQSLTFTPGAPVALAASTNYFLVASCSNCAPSLVGLNWRTSNPIVLAGLAGATVTTGSFFSSNGGTTWGSSTPSTPIFTVNGNTASTIPEPSTVGLVLSGLAIAACFRRR